MWLFYGIRQNWTLPLELYVKIGLASKKAVYELLCVMNTFAAVTQTIESCTATQILKDFLFAIKQKPSRRANRCRISALETSYLITCLKNGTRIRVTS